jgi:formate dehydrogenase subunit beta
MSTRWILETHGDPLGSVYTFLHNVWQQLHLDGMLVPVNGRESSRTKLFLLDDPQQLNRVNPFKPLMTLNAARMLPELVHERSQERLAVLLRPCEMRALIEMIKHQASQLEGLITICIDCLGTLPPDEYQWRAARKGAHNTLTQEALQFARQGGIVPYRYRSACQICFSPEARGADLNINVLGLPVRQHILVHVPNERLASQLRLEQITHGPAAVSVVEQRDQTVAKLVERRHRARQRVSHSLAESLPASVDELVTMLQECGNCQACLNSCPICAVDFPRKDESGRYLTQDVARWLVSCDGCGTCEQVCPIHRPLSAIFSHLRDVLAEEANYTPGYSRQEPLPLVSR